MAELRGSVTTMVRRSSRGPPRHRVLSVVIGRGGTRGGARAPKDEQAAAQVTPNREDGHGLCYPAKKVDRQQRASRPRQEHSRGLQKA